MNFLKKAIFETEDPSFQYLLSFLFAVKLFEFKTKGDFES